MLWETAVTFRWEVGFAFSFVGPVDHQVPIASETVGDFICNKKKKKNVDNMITFMPVHAICIRRPLCGATVGAENGTVSIFCPCSCCRSSHCIKQEHRPSTSSLTHEFFSRLRARIVHPLSCTCALFDDVDAYERKHFILSLQSLWKQLQVHNITGDWVSVDLWLWSAQQTTFFPLTLPKMCLFVKNYRTANL